MNWMTILHQGQYQQNVQLVSLKKIRKMIFKEFLHRPIVLESIRTNDQ